MTGKIFDMEQCHIDFFILDTEPVPCTDFLKMESLDTTCFKRSSNSLSTLTCDITVAVKKPAAILAIASRNSYKTLTIRLYWLHCKSSMARV